VLGVGHLGGGNELTHHVPHAVGGHLRQSCSSQVSAPSCSTTKEYTACHALTMLFDGYE
jgi:hypothetical protein